MATRKRTSGAKPVPAETRKSTLTSKATGTATDRPVRKAPAKPKPKTATAAATAQPAAATTTGMLDRSVAFDDGRTMPYVVYVPRDYAQRNDWPVVLFLHGAGERGSDGLLQTEVGIGTAIRRFPARWPGIVVMPQAPLQGRWAGAVAEVAMRALDATLAEFACDPSRVYLTGLSLGCEGAWYLAHEHRARFAALLAVCGWVGDRGPLLSFVPAGEGTPYDRVAARLRGLPTWIVHGEADVAVPVVESRRMAEALEAVGGPVTYSELPGVNHNAWDPAYQSEAIAAWLFAQRQHR